MRPSDMFPVLSIIVVTYNSAQDIAACLEALTLLQMQEPYEIIVVDNGSTDSTRAIVGHFAAVRLLALNANEGFATAHARGIEVAQGEFVALINPDAQAHPQWGHEMLRAMADPRVGVVGGKVLDLRGKIQSVGAMLDRGTMLSLFRGEGEEDRGQYDQRAAVWSAHGTSMAFRRRTWEQCDGFDDGFFPAYWEESDFCERVRLTGLEVRTAPQAVIVHRETASTGKGSAEFFYYFLRNRLRYAAKWCSWDELWNHFRLAEYARLATAPMIDRRVAALVYRQGVPTLGSPSQDERAAVLTTGQRLRAGALPDDGLDGVLALLEQARERSVLADVSFRSRWPAVAAMRGAWNSVATRWYVRPSLDQQTQWNQAIERAVTTFVERSTTAAAGSALDSALLAWRRSGT
ncbi:MAG: hypothetical protein NVS4B8_05500 [Herpetosiphon sp.]